MNWSVIEDFFSREAGDTVESYLDTPKSAEFLCLKVLRDRQVCTVDSVTPVA